MSASESQSGKQFYEFGPFRIDPEKEIVLRAGEPVSLTPKTFQILLVLIRHNKEVVTKDDLMKTVWPDTFVEEANLSRNIFMLRKALGDTPEDPYIVTVPGRGYRLAESVKLVPDQELSVIAATHSRVQVTSGETRPWRWIALAVVIAIALAAGMVRLFSPRPAVLSTRDTLLLADFANSTGDPVFDGTLRQGLAVQLEQSPYLSLVSEQRVRKTLRMMGKEPTVPVTGATAEELCERTGAAAVLEGSIATLGTEYVLGLRATNCHSGDVLDDEQVQVGRKEDVLNALAGVASKFRTRMGESRTMLQQHDKPIEEATTSSLDALKAYSTAMRVGFTNGFVAGIPFLKRAIEIDPNFAMAHAHLGLWYAGTGESELAARSTARGYELRDRATDRERYFITVDYDRSVTGNLDRATQTAESWAQTYPRDPYPHGLLSGFLSQGTGRYERSIQQAEQVLALDPDAAFAYVNLAFTYFYLGRPTEAEAVIQRAEKRNLEIPELYLLRYHIAVLRGDDAAMEQAVARVAGRPGAEDWMIHSEALVAAHAGQLQKARELSKQAAELAEHAGQPERAATYDSAAAVWEAFFGDTVGARRAATEALKLSKGRDVEYAVAFALLRTGDVSKAQELANDLSRRFPEDTSVQTSYLPTLRAMFALQQHHPEKAIDELQSATAEELAQTGLSFFAFFGNMYPAYVRGEAYLMSGKTAQAEAEFRKFLEHPGIVMSDPVRVMAEFQLAKIYRTQGDKDQADATRQHLLTVWKRADSDFPLLAKLRALQR